MRKIKLIFAIAICTFFVTSCDEEKLTLTNPTDLSPESYFKTATQVQSSVNAIYANLQTIGLYTRHMFFMMDNMSHENGGNNQLETDKRQYLDFAFDSSHGGIRAYWESCYRGINKANFVLGNSDKINEIPESFLSATDRAKFYGEAKFLRAYYYFLLVTRFGDVPLITGIPEGGTGFPRSPQEEVYQQIISDLNDASTTLLDKSNEQAGRATKGAALALLGKVHLYRKEYSAAMTAFDKITGYTLEPNYFDNFKEETEHGVEAIFAVEYDDDLGDGDKWNSDYSGAGANNVTFRGQEYGFNDWFNVFVSDDLLNEYEPGDSRFDDNFYVNGDTFAGGVVSAFPSNGGGNAAWRKYQNYYKDSNEDQASGINMKVLRYADVLLMMAEAENEVGNQATAVGYINQVRDRVNMPLLSTGLSKPQVFDAIVHERKVELAGEQSRFADLVRWGMAPSVLGQYGFQAGKHEVFPIPDAEISSNENINSEDQNPNY